MNRFALSLIMGLFSSALLADEAPETKGVFVDDQSRRHSYFQNDITGKAVQIFPDLDALDFSGRKAISSSNVEQVARKIIASLAEFSGVDVDELNLISARKTRLGMWIVSFGFGA